MKASLLLLFVLFHCASASQINWEECGDGKTAFCMASLCATGPDAKNEKLAQVEEVIATKKCDVGFHIKPESTNKWTISMVNEDQKSDPKDLHWKIDAKELFDCDGNTASLGKDGKSTGKLQLQNINPPTTDYPFCVFIVQSQGETIDDILTEIRKHTHSKKTVLISPKRQAGFPVDYSIVNNQLPCKKETLFKGHCEKDEDCDDPESDNVNIWKCKDGFDMMLSEPGAKNYTKAGIKCFAGNFYLYDSKTGNEDIPTGSNAKCARKKCSLCLEKDDFKSLYQKPTNFGECASLKCTNDTFMYMNTAKGVKTTSDAVQCSVKTKTNATEDARWVVEDEDEVEIESAECKQSVACEALIQIKPSCEGTDGRCEKPHLNSSGGYECKNGTMHVTLNETNVRIDPPTCESSGDWNVTMHLANSSSSILWSQKDNFTIKCILAPEAKKAAPVESSFPWLTILLVVLLLIVVAVAIGGFWFFKCKNKNKPSTPTPSKTSSSTSTSKKPSSSEQEPLTSAMTSVTGTGSVKTAIPAEQKPTVVVSNADLRGITATASSDPASKDKKNEEKKGEPNADKKEEKTSIGWPTEDTSKKQDINDVTSNQEKLAPMAKSAEGEELKSQTGGDGESQVSHGDKKTAESAKLLPKGAPRKYSKSGSKAAPKKKNDEFLNLTDSDDEPSKTGSKKKRNKKR